MLGDPVGSALASFHSDELFIGLKSDVKSQQLVVSALSV